MNLKNLQSYLDNISPPLKEVHKTALSSMLYDAYLEGIREGRNQIQTKLVEKLLALLETNT